MRIDDALLGRVVETLRLFDVAARTDARLLAVLRLGQQGAERCACVAIGSQLILRGEDRKVCLCNTQQQILLCADQGGLRTGGLEAGLLQLIERLPAPQRLCQRQCIAVYVAIAMFRLAVG